MRYQRSGWWLNVRLITISDVYFNFQFFWTFKKEIFRFWDFLSSLVFQILFTLFCIFRFFLWICCFFYFQLNTYLHYNEIRSSLMMMMMMPMMIVVLRLMRGSSLKAPLLEISPIF